ncbi:GNAT family N-acetyltransferase [Halobacillus trueperi]|uniref:GNAT family N-acetyltransferase n=1 Tax=Halobacillus trueperi TaxID=156205 RepID=A0A3D8VR14_9BACI|nr:GNAT family N-acetyltransferase [Halobacillus trueperi]RDY71856.1 GNAT family N-acetyltransferase [Halobacillus trueperi]REJ08676.1 GNAT family N-acetyltransferase [Halobacillus trueperi]
MIRSVKLEDAEGFVPLMDALGYPSSKEQIKNRLQSILPQEHYQTFVYEANDELLGMIGMTFSEAYHTDDPHVRIIAFVVRETEQGKGIGKMLMEKAGEWALTKGAKTIMLNSGNRAERKKAHEIYHSFGFEGRATGFYKRLD